MSASFRRELIVPFLALLLCYATPVGSRNAFDYWAAKGKPAPPFR